MLPHPTQNARNLRLRRNFPAIFKQVAWMNLGASASWVEEGREGYESSAQEGRASGATFLQQSLQLLCQGSQHLQRGTHVSKTPMSPPSDKGEPRVVGAGTWETEEGPCGWDSPNQ